MIEVMKATKDWIIKYFLGSFDALDIGLATILGSF